MAYQSRKKKKQKEFKVRYRVWGVLILIVALFGAVYYYSRYEPWMFQTIEFEGNERVDIQKLEQRVWLELESPWYVLFAQNNRLFFPKERVTQMILENDPLIEQVEINLGKNQTLTLIVQERGPQYVVCDQGVIDFAALLSEEKGQQCAFVDYNGLSYEYYDDSVEHEALFVDHTLGSVRVPVDFFDKEEVLYLREVQGLLGDFPLKKIVFRPTESTDVYLTQDFHVKFTELTPLVEQFQNIEIALGQPLAELPLGEYEYIDARFPGKLYVRERTEPLEEPNEPVDNEEVLEEEA